MNFGICHGNFVLHVPKVFRETSTVKFLERQVLLSFWRQVLLSKSSEGKKLSRETDWRNDRVQNYRRLVKKLSREIIGEKIGPK